MNCHVNIGLSFQPPNSLLLGVENSATEFFSLKTPNFLCPRKKPIFPIPETLQFLGTGTAKILGIFGVYPRISPFFGAGDGERAFKDFGDAFGTGKTQILEIGENPRKSLNFGVGAGERISRIFPPLM